MVCIGVYQDHGANPAIEIIPPVSAHLWEQHLIMVNMHGGKGECDNHLRSCFHSHELLIRDWPSSGIAGLSAKPQRLF